MLMLSMIIGVMFIVFSCVLKMGWDKNKILSKMYYSDMDETFSFIGGVILIISTIVSVGLMVNITYASTLNEKIAILQEENEIIESEINDIAVSYMQYEKNTFSDLKVDGDSFFYFYPELKTDEIVRTQIDILYENRKTINEIKLKQTMIPVYKWWLYFGN